MADMSSLQQDAVSEAYKYSHLYSFSGSNKAGMDGMDKDKQAQIIHEMSKDSAFFKRAAKLDAEADVKVQSMKKVLAEVKGPLEAKLRNEVLQRSMDLEQTRNFSRICCVLDMDMFYAAVEIRDQPHLKDLPVAVGGMSMISTANYVARKYGVRAAMPGFIAKKLCPQLVFVGMSFDKYQSVSDQVKDIIGEYDPEYTSHTLDEVYFDLAEAAMSTWKKRHNCDSETDAETHAVTDGTNDSSIVLPTLDSIVNSAETPDIFTLRAIAVDLLQEIRRRITQVTNGLTCSAGIANNHFLAKIGADVNKPDGQFELPPTREAVLEFVTTLPTRKVGGIGKVTERMLESLLGVKSMGQVRDHLPQLLHVMSPILFQFLLRTSMGIGSHEGDDHRHDATDSSEKKAYMRKSLGCERTFNSKGISDSAELYTRLHKICQHVADDMASEDLWARAVTLKLKNLEFELITRIATSSTYFQSAEAIEGLAKGLLAEALPVNIRLMGVSVSKFKQPEVEVDPKQRNILMFLKTKTAGEGVSETALHSPGKGEQLDVDTDDRMLQLSEGVAECHESVDEVKSGLQHCGAISDTGTSGTSASSATTSTATSVSVVGQLHECPVCGAQVPGMLARFNQHLDRCLGLGDATESTGVAPKRVSSGPKSKKMTANAKLVPSEAAEGRPKQNALIAALAAAASKSANCEVMSVDSLPTTHKTIVSATTTLTSTADASSVHGKRSGDSSSARHQGAKVPRKDALALEITDYFTSKR